MRSCDFQPTKNGHIPHKNQELAWPGTIFQIQQNNGRNECIVFTSRGACFRLALLLTNNGKTMYGNFLLFLFMPVKRICWKGYFFTFRIFFKIIMKDKWFNILQTYKITSKIRHYFQKLVTCNEKTSFSELKPLVIRTRFHSLSNECNDLFRQA